MIDRPYADSVTSKAGLVKSAGGRFCDAEKPDGSRCTMPAGYNTDHLGFGHCYGHFGRTASGKQAAAVEQANHLAKFYGTPIDVSPGEVLMDEVRRTAGHVAFLAAEIGKWNFESGNIADGPSDALLGWIRLYHAERAHLTKVAKAALDAGVQERQVSLAENVGAQVADVIDRILAKLVLTEDQKKIVPLVVPQELRQVIATREDRDEQA